MKSSQATLGLRSLDDAWESLLARVPETWSVHVGRFPGGDFSVSLCDPGRGDHKGGRVVCARHGSLPEAIDDLASQLGLPSK